MIMYHVNTGFVGNAWSGEKKREIMLIGMMIVATRNCCELNTSMMLMNLEAYKHISSTSKPLNLFLQ